MQPTDLIPLPDQFAHPSLLHGQNHVARVMVHAFRLLEASGLHQESSRLWAAVFLHDLARTHDGTCPRHGADAVAGWRKSPALDAHFARGGVVSSDHDSIALAVTIHCRSNRNEPPPGDPNWALVALLKDADALDRVRLGDLDPTYLRLPETAGMIDFAEELYQETYGRIPEGPAHFEQVMNRAAKLACHAIAVPERLAQG